MRGLFWRRPPQKDANSANRRRSPTFEVSADLFRGDPDLLDEVAAQISESVPEVEESDETLVLAAHQAEAEGDWQKALGLWQRFTRRAEDGPEGYLGQAEAYRALKQPAEADSILRMSLGVTSPQWAVSYALNAGVAEDWEEVLVRWQAARTAHPNLALAWAAEASILQILGRALEAEALMRQALPQFPESIEVHAQHCNVAVALGNWLELKRRWSELERRFPDSPYVVSRRADVLQMVRAGIEEASTENLAAYVSRLEAASAWTDAAAIWREIHARDPRQAHNIIGLGRALRESQRFTEADRVLDAGIEMFPKNLEMRAHYAQVAAARLDWAEAASRWQKTLWEFPDQPVVWGLAATAFLEAGLIYEAETLLERGIREDPERLEFLVHHALAAERASAWTIAVERWNKLLKLRPDDANFRSLRDNAIAQDRQARN